MSELLRTFGLFVVTALAEIIGCYLPYLWLNQGKSIWLLVPAMIALAAFAWLLTLPPFSAGRTYAAYGGVYILVAIIWLWLIDRIAPTPWDMAGAAVALAGMAVIVLNLSVKSEKVYDHFANVVIVWARGQSSSGESYLECQ